MEIGAAAAASATTSRPSFNPSFFLSPAGWFKVAEFALGMLVWPLIASVSGYSAVPGLQFVMFVSVTVWCLTTILIGLYMFSVHSTTLSSLPWDIIEFVHNAFWALMYFIAAVVEAVYTGNVPVLQASTAFAFFLTFVLAAHTAYAWKVWRGSLPIPSFNTEKGTEVNK